MSVNEYVDENILKNIKDAANNLNSEYRKFIKSQLILKVFEELMGNDKLPENLCDKLSSNLILVELQNDTLWNSNSKGNFNLLGITSDDVDSNNLTTNEKSTLKSEITRKLSEIYLDFNKKLITLKAAELISPNHENGYYTILNNNKMDILKSHDEFICKINHYNCLLESTKKLLNESINCRISINTLSEESFDLLSEQAKLLKLKAKIFQYKIEKMIFSLNDKAFVALSILNDQLKTKEVELLEELNRLNELHNQFEKLERTEFKEIAKRYKQVLKQTEHFKWVLKEFSPP